MATTKAKRLADRRVTNQPHTKPEGKTEAKKPVFKVLGVEVAPVTPEVIQAFVDLMRMLNVSP